MSEPTVTILHGHAIDEMRKMPENSVQMAMTSPPYFGLRDYSRCSCVQPSSAREAETNPQKEGRSEIAEDQRGDRHTPGGAIAFYRPGIPDPNCQKCHGTGKDDSLNVVWDAKPECEHEWGDEVPGSSRSGSRTPTDKNNRGEGYARAETKGSFCRLCGAWHGQLGLEPTPELYIQHLVQVFHEVKRVLRDDGTCWINLGDAYATGTSTPRGPSKNVDVGRWRDSGDGNHRVDVPGLKPKDLIGMPWLVAKALQAPRYLGKIRSESDRAYLAGLIDGEGTISFVERDRGEDHTSTHDIRVFITNCDRAPMDYFAGFIGGHIYQHENGERENRFGSRPCFRWQMGTHESAQILREVYPYLRIKRKQAALIWTLYMTLRHKNGHARTPVDVVAKRREIADLVRALNTGEDVEMPSWVVEPDSQGLWEPGWYLRSDIIWHKLNPMPESIKSRPTKAHEYVFLLAKSEDYFYDSDAIREPILDASRERGKYGFTGTELHNEGMVEAHHGKGFMRSEGRPVEFNQAGRNARTVWSIPNGAEAHALGDGTFYIASEDCPVHSPKDHQTRIGSTDGHDARLNPSDLHTLGIDEDRDSSPASEQPPSSILGSPDFRHASTDFRNRKSSPTKTQRNTDVSKTTAGPSPASGPTDAEKISPHSLSIPVPPTDSLDLMAHDDSDSATSRNMETRRTVSSSSPHDTASGQSSLRTPYKRCSCQWYGQSETAYTTLRREGGGTTVLTIPTQPFAGAHFATFPPKLVEPCIKAGTSEKGACGTCGAPMERVIGNRVPNVAREQTRRAVEIAKEHGLTDAHLNAIRAAGITDTGKATETQSGTGRNTEEIRHLAKEAKDALGGYYREFVSGIETTLGWAPTCDCMKDPCRVCGKPWIQKRIVRLVSNMNIRVRDAKGILFEKSGLFAAPHGASDEEMESYDQDESYREEVQDVHFPDCDCGIQPCVVLDPFGGSGTVGQVAKNLRRSVILIEIKEEYIALAKDRVNTAQRTIGDFA